MNNTERYWYEIRGSLYLNICDRCTLRCQFCPKTQGINQVHHYDLSLARQPEAEQVIATLPDLMNYKEVVFCGYGEPTLRLKQLLAIARYCKKYGIRTRLNTDGLGNVVHKRDIIPELAEVVDSVSISLNAQDTETYTNHCQPQLKSAYLAVHQFIRRAVDFFAEVRVTAIEGLEGVDIEQCRTIAERYGATFVPRYLDKVG
ncbi:TatD family nuclease-associated radical SAM protein [Kangiella shandongensis]|uniref:TatD family nuclease-associated radical SAM protein n=1 Tax=Kangiella shandongensis TaxID=2763258 RepID=UPI001CBFCEDE|nr:TatD family nuclease-associated radical SAM protein [Kangiella shandongensis]